MPKRENQMEHDDARAVAKRGQKKVYVPGMSRTLKESEELVYDSKAYLMLHTFETDFPCLSFDILPDSLGDNRQNYPMTAWLASGTQAEKARDNQLLVMRLSNMHANKKALEAKEKERNGQRQDEEDEDESSSSSDESSDDDEEDGQNGDRGALANEPRMHAALIPHYGGINRIKCTRLGPSDICAVWNDQAKVQVWNLSPCISAVEERIELESPSKWQRMENQRPLFTFAGHSGEGFALAWSQIQTGTLASGDVHRKIFLWRMAEGGQWLIDQRPLGDHQGSVEDLVWSPTEEALLISCSTDRTIRLWDVRSPAKDACVCTVRDAHESDVNVISVNGSESLILSGGDDAALRVWSMKTIQYNQPVAQFHHHQKPITSVEWSPHDNTLFMASGEDDQTTIWDLALEEDEPIGHMKMEEEKGEEKGEQTGNEHPQLPPQLLFIHMGQNEVKEVHWHGQCPGVAFSTAQDGFHVFKTINC